MNILCIGDSWTVGYGVPKSESWPIQLQNFTGSNVKIIGGGGANNFYLLNSIKYQHLSNYDVLILGWSGVTRYCYLGKKIDFCWAENYKLRDNFFKTKSLSDMEKDFLNLNQEVNELCRNTGIKKIIKFSVFGDFKYLWDDKFIDVSFLDFLSKKQGNNFVNEIPFFEYDFFSELNYKNTKRFAKKYFSRGWEQAIIERNQIRPGKYFLDCGHPNAKGHHAWAEYLTAVL